MNVSARGSHSLEFSEFSPQEMGGKAPKREESLSWSGREDHGVRLCKVSEPSSRRIRLSSGMSLDLRLW